jgi:hypothetical protein
VCCEILTMRLRYGGGGGGASKGTVIGGNPGISMTV